MPELLLPIQQLLQPPLPTIQGNVDYHRLRQQLLRIDQLLGQSGLEAQFIAASFEIWKTRTGFKRIPAKAQRKLQIHARRALRCNIVRSLLLEDFRGLAVRLADSPLFQHFCGLAELDHVHIPSKSTLQRYSQWADEATVRSLVNQLTQKAHTQPKELSLRAALDLEACFLDTTTVEANIHYPVDWVLLRDASTTLMKALALIREQGLRHRMAEPSLFIRQMNILAMQMTHTWSEADSKRQRKRVLRKMDKLVGSIARHAKRYRQLLDQQWQQTQWTRGQVDYVLRRLDNVLKQLPAARQQARQRIIQERLVRSKDKILSLYEPDVQVIVRHKPGAEVEFGNTLLLGENHQGVILDWQLFKEVAPNDARLVKPTVERVEKNLAVHVEAVAADRGFDSESNQQWLAQRKTYNAICPRSVKQLQQRKGSWKFTGLQRRRSQCEGRIGIVKNNFLGQPMRSKGFANRELALSWAVLTHNLWVIARLPQRKVRAKIQSTPLALAA
jgi:hypothetical protein